MIFPIHVMAPRTVTSFFKRPLVDNEFGMPAVEFSDRYTASELQSY
jgi:hypothetical protein